MKEVVRMHHSEDILKLLETDSRLTSKEVAILLNLDEKLVAETIKHLEDEKIIAGYHTIINWEKTDDEYVSAMIEVRVTPQRGQGFDRIAEKIYQFPEVKAMHLISGGYDYLVELKKAPMRQIANFVSSRLSVIEEVQSTATHVVLKRYKDHNTIFVKDDEDKRMVVSP